MLLGASIMQWSAAIATALFAVMAPSATSAWRLLLGAVMLVAFVRPDVRGWSRHQWLWSVVLGLSITVMNQGFYQAIARIPLGAAVAIEYLGPFLLAAFGRRSARHLAFVALAGAGVLAIARPGGGLNFWGVVFAASAALGWGVYVLAAHHVGAQATGFAGLAVAMVVSAVLTLPLSLGSSVYVFSHPASLVRLSIVALMAIVLGYAFELQGLRRIRPAVAGVISAFDPAMAFAIGFVLLSQHISVLDALGMAGVVIAGAGVTYDAASADAVVAQ